MVLCLRSLYQTPNQFHWGSKLLAGVKTEPYRRSQRQKFAPSPPQVIEIDLRQQFCSSIYRGESNATGSGKRLLTFLKGL